MIIRGLSDIQLRCGCLPRKGLKGTFLQPERMSSISLLWTSSHILTRLSVLNHFQCAAMHKCPPQTVHRHQLEVQYAYGKRTALTTIWSQVDPNLQELLEKGCTNYEMLTSNGNVKRT